MSPMSAEATVVRNYLDTMLGLPWGKKSKLKRDIIEAQKVLDADHFGLEKVKDRIIEYLAVQARTNRLKGPILCLVGPPGVGKTSLGRSIAKATGREFVRQSLGGVRDEAEIRGHRRTYIGSLPGKILTNIKKAGTSNPLFLLDEIDKLGTDFRGDPSSALLEVLDPEQNAKFNDHYLEVDYDLSDVMFVTTANTLNMPQPLMDRMEIIHLSGYTEDEKVEIAKGHLIPKQYEAHGLKLDEWELTESGLRGLIRYYTREAGVRTLEREIAKLARKSLRQILEGKHASVVIDEDNLGEYAGTRKFRFGIGEEEDQIGATTGLAWTEVGGELLTIEAVTVPGKGAIKTTGKLGEVMQESVAAALSFVKAPRSAIRHQAERLQPQGHPRPRSRGRYAQGRPVGGRGDGDRDHLDADRYPRPSRGGDDRRGDAARARAADRRPEGEAAGGDARRPDDRSHPGGQREGPGRHPGEREGGADDRACRARRRSALSGSGAAGRSDRMDRSGRTRRSPAAGPRRGCGGGASALAALGGVTLR